MRTDPRPGDPVDETVSEADELADEQLITVVGAGAGAAGAAHKFEQHKENPTQIPIGTPIVPLVIGAGLVIPGTPADHVPGE